jgi:hypothetical protein
MPPLEPEGRISGGGAAVSWRPPLEISDAYHTESTGGSLCGRY